MFFVEFLEFLCRVAYLSKMEDQGAILKKDIAGVQQDYIRQEKLKEKFTGLPSYLPPVWLF